MKKAKVLCLLLTASMIFLSFLSSCSEKAGQQDPAETEPEGPERQTVSEAAETEAPPVDSLEARLSYSDELPEADYDGRSFHILGYDFTCASLWTDELNGDVVNDALFNRQAKVNERFNVVLAMSGGESYGGASNTAKNSVTAGDDEFQLYCSHVVQMGIDVTSNIYRNLYEIPNLDFSKPWWSPEVEKNLTYKGKAFLAVGDFDLSALHTTMCLFYNKGLAAEYGLEDIYSVVKSGDWTKDRFYTVTAVYEDLNGDGICDSDDRYGFALDRNGDANTWIYAFDKKVLEPQEDGSFANVYYDEKIVSIVEWAYDLQFKRQSTYSEDVWNTGLDMIVKEKTLIGVGGVRHALSYLRDSEIDYAIIPFPKWDVQQDGYHTYVGGSHDTQGVLLTVKDADFVGTIIEALNAEGWKTVSPAYYDNALKYKGARDEESIEMLDILLDGRIFDFGYVYGGFETPASWLRRVINGGSADIASYVQRNTKVWDKTMAKVYKAFDEYEG
jgi:ABC-type glycerol-3-phosphate transport system substrate-binding protein